jgi:hypothetical protein
MFGAHDVNGVHRARDPGQIGGGMTGMLNDARRLRQFVDGWGTMNRKTSKSLSARPEWARARWSAHLVGIVAATFGPVRANGVAGNGLQR